MGGGGAGVSLRGVMFRSEGSDGRVPGRKGFRPTWGGRSGTGGAFDTDSSNCRRAVSSLFSKSLTFLLSLYCFAMSLFDGSLRSPRPGGLNRACSEALSTLMDGTGGVSDDFLTGDRWICEAAFFSPCKEGLRR